MFASKCFSRMDIHPHNASAFAHLSFNAVIKCVFLCKKKEKKAYTVYMNVYIHVYEYIYRNYDAS